MFLNPRVLDLGLASLAREGLVLWLTPAEPQSYDDAKQTRICERLNPVMLGPSNASNGGRKVVVQNITDGIVWADGRVTHWSIVDPAGDGMLLVIGPLTAPLDVVEGNRFTLTDIDIVMPGLPPTAEPV